MIKFNTFTPQGNIVKKVSAVAKNLKEAKNANLGISGLPKEESLDCFREKRLVQMLRDSFCFDRAKDAVTIATINNKK